MYRNWLDSGAPNNKPFYRGSGLCVALSELFEFGPDLYPLRMEMNDQFNEAGAVQVYKGTFIPFNSSLSQYQDEVYEESCYLNPKRVKWIMNRTEKQV